MNENNGSTSALIELGRGGKRRSGSKTSHRDQVLKGICAMPGCTVNEMAVNYYDWMREPYKNAAKRARDLVKLGYVDQLDNRKCKFSGKDCHTYRITEHGVDYLKKENLMPVIKKKEVDPVPAAIKKPSFADMRSALS